jgi:hypothetical protein
MSRVRIPIRYSSAEDCARPVGQQIGKHLRITLDGIPARRVVAYDIERGEIVRTVIDRRGNPLRNPAQPDEWLMQTVRGKVAVEWVEDAPDA